MKKTALIIGNSSYPEAPLKNPINDANAIEERLSQLGFEAIKFTNSTRVQMDEGLKEFNKMLVAYDVALFFFAGHGMQIEGNNYLTAIDTEFDTELDAKHSSIPLNKVIDIMEAGKNQTEIIILDACRNNPFERRWRGTESRGLAPVYTPKGMIIGYATSPGQVASDGEGSNGAYTGAYTEAFLKHVSTPDITIEDLFKRVRNTLSSSTRGKQISWEHTSLMGDFYFNYSFDSSEKIAVYDEDALADMNFIVQSSPVAREIINGLKSYSWYSQNPAMGKIDQITLEQFTKDDLFVLGRNINQAACGTASAAMNYLDSLKHNLDYLEEGIAFHLLNGVLFEIYFDSTGRFRSRPKADMIDSIFLVADSEEYQSSFDFINHVLRPYYKNLFYFPSSPQKVNIDVTLDDIDEGKKIISGVFFEGDNVLYDEFGDEYFDPEKEHSVRKVSKEVFRWKLSEALVTPTYKLKISYSNLPDDVDSLLTPSTLNIKRLAN